MTTLEAAQKAEAEAKVLRAEAEAVKAKAKLAERYAENDNDKKEAWEAYDEANHQAEVAELEAKHKHQEARWEQAENALTEALKVKVRDYLLVDDIAEQATRIPAELTFGNLVDETERIQWSEGMERKDAILETVENLDERIHEATGYYFDTEAREKLYRTITWLYQQADDDEIRLLDCVPAEA